MKQFHKPLLILLVLLQLAAVQTTYPAVETDSLEAIRTSLDRAGEHRFVYRMFFKLYDASLYTNVEETANTDKLLNGQNALLLEFDYLRTIKKSVILESSEKILTNNMTPAELASIQERVNQINDAYKTVGKGDRSALSYVPGKGTTLWINDKSIITIEGEDFVRLYFRIWLGERPISVAMRDALLQRSSS